MLTEEKIREWQAAARRDDACTFFVPSDIRVMLAEVVRLRAALNNLSNAAAIVFSCFEPKGGSEESAKALLKMELGLKDGKQGSP